MRHPAHKLLAFVDGTSRHLKVTAEQPLLIGTADDGHWSPGIDAPDQVARIIADKGSLLLTAVVTEGPWQPRLNGRPVTGQVRLYGSDIVTLNTAQLVCQGSRRQSPGGTVVDADEFRVRLALETERSTRTRRTLSVVVLRHDGASADTGPSLVESLRSDLRQVDLVSALRPGLMAILMPETDQRAQIPARRIVERLLPVLDGLRAGFAVCPQDASDPDALLAGARAAADEAAAGKVCGLHETAGILPAGPFQLVAVEPAMRKLLELVRRLAPAPFPVLISGETGVGKEYIAQALHHWSNRPAETFVAVNCAAVAETLFESELFGHEKGAFTGASETKRGLLEAAHGGTLLLDEIGECPPGVQAKLLRVIETRSYNRVGSVRERTADIRILAATNRDLQHEVSEGRFRADLYYRLNAATVAVPPLSDRPLDIPILARLLLDEACQRMSRSTMTLSPDALRRLVLHDWPGNVRELRNVLDLATATVPEDTLSAEDLPADVAGRTAPWLAHASPVSSAPPSPEDDFALRPHASLKDELQALEKRRIQQALEATGGTQNKAAELLAMPLRTFVSRLKQYAIDTAAFKGPRS